MLAAGLAASAVVYDALVHNVPGMAANRADAVRTALLVVGGSGALAGLYVAYRKQRTDEANHLRDQDKLFTERYTQAVTQLGSAGSAAIRLGGVYALARIADDSERDRPTCLRVLCAYLRMPYDPADGEAAEREVRTTAQSVLAERLRPEHPGFWSEADVDLRGACLIDMQLFGAVVRTFQAQGAKFIGDTWFNEATFAEDAWFNEATFSGDASFRKAVFVQGAWFNAATFSGDAWFAAAAFKGDTGFGGSIFAKRAGFGEAAFGGDAFFNEVAFEADAGFGKATFAKDAWFGKATFSGDTWLQMVAFTGDVGFEDVRFSRYADFFATTFAGDVDFGGTAFSRDHAPSWPAGFAEPPGIIWQVAASRPAAP